MLMAPVVPSVATTRLGVVRPAVQLRSEANDLAVVDGWTVKKLEAFAFVTVTLRMAAVANRGTPLPPATGRVLVPPEPTGALLRVSRMRTGFRGVENRTLVVPPVK